MSESKSTGQHHLIKKTEKIESYQIDFVPTLYSCIVKYLITNELVILEKYFFLFSLFFNQLL